MEGGGLCAQRGGGLLVRPRPPAASASLSSEGKVLSGPQFPHLWDGEEKDLVDHRAEGQYYRTELLSPRLTRVSG